MKLRRDPSRGLILSHLPESQLRLLQQIPLHADPAGSRRAQDRLYQDPVRHPSDGLDDEVNDDWQELIEPELRAAFADQLEIVAADVNAAQPQAGEEMDEEDEEDDDEEDFVGEMGTGARDDTVYYHFTIPFDHVEAWYGALNQARLVMQERYQFPEVESLESTIAILQSENLQPYLISRFYMEIQSALLGMVMDREE